MIGPGDRAQPYLNLANALGVLGPVELAEFRDYLLPGTLLPPNISGGTPVNLLCKELLRRGYPLVIFSLHQAVDKPQTFEGEHLRIHLGPFRPSAILDSYKEERRFLTCAIAREKVALLHAHFTYEYALAASDTDLPFVVTAHDAPINCALRNVVFSPYGKYNTQSYYRTVRGFMFWAARVLIAYKVTRGAPRLVAVSPYVAQHLRRYRFTQNRIEVIPNGVPDEYFEYPRGKGPGNGCTFATALGGWGRLKNGAAAIEAFAIARRIIPNLQMLMFGHGYSPDGPAAAWARRRGWDGGIEFRGRVLHEAVIHELARRADVLVHPSIEEAHPMPLVEAMSLGIPVIGGKHVGGVPWTLGEGAYGALVDVRSPAVIASAMLKLARGGELRTRMGAVAREFAKARFHVRQVADRYEAIYAELSAGGGDLRPRRSLAPVPSAPKMKP